MSWSVEFLKKSLFTRNSLKKNSRTADHRAKLCEYILELSCEFLSPFKKLLNRENLPSVIMVVLEEHSGFDTSRPKNRFFCQEL